jgi:hypothetical protein
VQEALCAAATEARREVVAGKPFMCDACGGRFSTERGRDRHPCGKNRHVFTPLQARVFPAAAAAASFTTTASAATETRVLNFDGSSKGNNGEGVRSPA